MDPAKARRARVTTERMPRAPGGNKRVVDPVDEAVVDPQDQPVSTEPPPFRPAQRATSSGYSIIRPKVEPSDR